jgi:hypothetical protein
MHAFDEFQLDGLAPLRRYLGVTAQCGIPVRERGGADGHDLDMKGDHSTAKNRPSEGGTVSSVNMGAGPFLMPPTRVTAANNFAEASRCFRLC